VTLLTSICYPGFIYAKKSREDFNTITRTLFSQIKSALNPDGQWQKNTQVYPANADILLDDPFNIPRRRKC
jgi:hypothetical protein